MSLPHLPTPPTDGTPYIIPQLLGERLTIPGSKGVFRILASAAQTDGVMSVFQSGGTVADAPGFHFHNGAHDIFIVTKGFLKLWNGSKCRVMGPGDFASVPPKIIHNPATLGPHTETFGVVTPGSWIDFFRYVGEPYAGILAPESDDRDLKSLLIPKVMAAKGEYDVQFVREYDPPALGDWDEADSKLPDSVEPYYLRANTGPRWIAGGVLSRPFITTKQNGASFAISSIESSNAFSTEGSVLARRMAFRKVHHCLAVLEGTLAVVLEDKSRHLVREGETAMLPAGLAFSLEFDSRFVRIWSFATGDGIEALVQKIGEPFVGVVLPDEAKAWDEKQVKEVGEELDVEIS